MKRKIITLCTALFALGIHAQISTPMWENFEGSSLVLENITYEGTGSETMGVEENPQKSGINKSEKCFALTATNQHDWWHKLHIAPAEGEYFMPASDKHVYLHFKMYRTRIGDASEVHVYDEKGTQDGHFQAQFNNTKANCWEDFVFDLTSYVQAGKGISKIVIQPELQWNGPGAVPETKYLLDDFQLMDSSYPDGAQILEITDIANFDDPDMTAKNLMEWSSMDPNASCTVVDNPSSEAVNLTKKVLCYDKPASAVWWHALQLPINGLVKAEYPNTNLHIMMYTGGQTVRVIVKDHMGNQARSEYMPYDATSWEDFVFDISELKGETISAIEFLFGFNGEDNWDNPAGKFYIDEIILNDEFDAREEVSTGINELKDNKSGIAVYSADGSIYVKGSNLNKVDVYTAAGTLVTGKAGNMNECSMALPQGMYIVKIQTVNGEIVARSIVNK